MSAELYRNYEVRRLLNEHVPEIASGVVEIKGIAREAGRHVIIVVHAQDGSVCPVGSCVGRRGLRIKTVMKALPGDKINVVRWSESAGEYIRNLLAPVKVEEVLFDTAGHRATVAVSGDSTRLTADEGVVLRLASRLVGWDLQLTGT
jgi:N utilization substance protein A